MRFFRLFVAALWLLALGVSAVPARAAGTISISPPTWKNRADDRLINRFNRKDCLDDAIATFSVSIRNAPTNALFQVWSGTGCDQYANRSPTAVSNTCTRLTDELAPLDQTVVLHLRDMLADYGATVDQSASECDASSTAGLQNRSLYFVVSDPSNNMTLATGNGTWAFSYDVKAPPPPSNVSANSGDGSLVTRFTAPSGETNLLHYRFYCSLVGDAPATSGTGGTDGTAGTGGTAGTSGTDATAGVDSGGAAAETGGTGSDGTAGTAAAVDPFCQSSILVPGQPPPSDAIDCGSIGAQGANGGETSPILDNDVQYVVAVATEDNVNNVGVLSSLACGVPRDTTGFYEAYREAGGQAGGGYCTFAPARRGAMASVIALLLGACALWRRRK
jgi:hypothetical protein